MRLQAQPPPPAHSLARWMRALRGNRAHCAFACPCPCARLHADLLPAPCLHTVARCLSVARHCQFAAVALAGIHRHAADSCERQGASAAHLLVLEVLWLLIYEVGSLAQC